MRSPVTPGRTPVTPGMGLPYPDSPQGLLAERNALAQRVAELTAERDRLQRACDEGLPRERIDCPGCGKRHIEGPRHDDETVDGSKRPHHTHRCYHCAHVWDSGRWSFGVSEPSEEQRLALADNPEMDSTPGAHPAWTRGHDYACDKMQEALDRARKEAAAARNDAREAWAQVARLSDGFMGLP